MKPVYALGLSHGQSPEWTAVEDGLPEIDSTVLVWKPSRGDYDFVTYSKESEEHRKFTRRDGQWWDSGSRITHWQPRPLPPKAVKNGD